MSDPVWITRMVSPCVTRSRAAFDFDGRKEEHSVVAWKFQFNNDCLERRERVVGVVNHDGKLCIADDIPGFLEYRTP